VEWHIDERYRNKYTLFSSLFLIILVFITTYIIFNANLVNHIIVFGAISILVFLLFLLFEYFDKSKGPLTVRIEGNCIIMGYYLYDGMKFKFFV